jgi:hypothetical protein
MNKIATNKNPFQCFANHETMFSIITWAGHLNSMLNPLIYSRFSRDFRKAFKQILTCERERPTKKAIKSPLHFLFQFMESMFVHLVQEPAQYSAGSAEQHGADRAATTVGCSSPQQQDSREFGGLTQTQRQQLQRFST